MITLLREISLLTIMRWFSWHSKTLKITKMFKKTCTKGFDKSLVFAYNGKLVKLLQTSCSNISSDIGIPPKLVKLSSMSRVNLFKSDKWCWYVVRNISNGSIANLSRHNLSIAKVFAYNFDYHVIVHYVTIVLIQKLLRNVLK